LVTLTWKFSSGSQVASPLVVTVKVLLVWPAVMTWPSEVLAT
jgi:hypothetical protein